MSSSPSQNNGSPWPLEPDRQAREQWLAELSAFVQDQIDGLPEAHARGILGHEANAIADKVSVAIPEAPLAGGLPRIIDILDKATQASLTTAGPGYLAYVPGGGLYTSALADFVAGCLNRYTGSAAADTRGALQPRLRCAASKPTWWTGWPTLSDMGRIPEES